MRVRDDHDDVTVATYNFFLILLPRENPNPPPPPGQGTHSLRKRATIETAV